MAVDDHPVKLCQPTTSCENPVIDTPTVLLLIGGTDGHDVEYQTVESTSRQVENVAGARYGDSMSPLDIDAAALLLSPGERGDGDVIRFLLLCEATSRAEKISDPRSWSQEERNSFNCGDWQTFSRMRGYSDQEISEYGEFILLSNALDLKYGTDYAISLSHLVDIHTKKV